MKKLTIFIALLFFNLMVINASNSKFKVTLDKCIDGDTARFNINGDVKTVRFLSINAPEIAHDDISEEPFGVEASEFTCNALKNASVIKLQYDPKSDSTDKYERVLAWVFVDNNLLQESIVRNGLAEVKYVYDDYLYSSNLKELENQAREKRIGIWSNFYVDKATNFDLDFAFYIFIVLVIFLINSLIRKIFSRK